MFQSHGRRRVEASFSGGRLTGKAGALLLRERERKQGFIRRFARCFRDYRDPSRIEHQLEELLAQRTYGFVLGEEDLCDHDELRADRLLALLCGKVDLEGKNRRRERDRGKALASSSTLSRLERGGIGEPSRREAKITFDESQVERFFIEECIASYCEPPERVFLDIDPSDVEVHGHQVDSAYNRYYGHRCYLPLYVFCDDRPLLMQLRSSSFDPAFELMSLLNELLDELRKHWPETHIIVRADSAFAREPIFAAIEQRKAAGERIDYVIAFARNEPLLTLMSEARREARTRHLESNQPERVFAELCYQTKRSWSRSRRVVGKAEYARDRYFPRFIVTSLDAENVEARELYEEWYCPRGQMENHIKEQQLDLFGDQLSSTEFEGNQVRMFLVGLAHLILGDFRRAVLCGTKLAKARCVTIRNKLLCIAATVRISCRRIVFALDSDFARKQLFFRLWRRLIGLSPSSGHAD